MQEIKSSDSHVLIPGRNIISFDIPPQKPGSYVLGALTGQIGKLSFRSHGFSQDGPVETDEFMSFEKPTRPVLKVIAVIKLPIRYASYTFKTKAGNSFLVLSEHG